MPIAHLKIALFALFLAAPVATLLLSGSVESFGREQPDFPEPREMLRGKGRTQLGDAVLERSAAMKLAVKLQNWVGYRLVGFVEARTVVSGKDEWLFHRPDFQEGACIEFDKVAVYFRQLAVLMDMSRASGLDLRISLSPNKSTIYPDELNPLVRGYWRCQARNVAGLRRLFKSELPDMIDHAEPLLAERSRRPDIPLYFTTDTHWTPYGGAIAIRQLLTAVYPGMEFPAPQLSGATKAQRMDLAVALLWPAEEPADEVAPLPRTVLDQLDRRSGHVRTLITHDSFFTRIESQIREAFPNAILVRGAPRSPSFTSEIARADRLIVNMVERGFVKAIQEGALSWEAPIASTIMMRNVKLAADCGSFEAVHRNADSTDQERGGAGEALVVPAMAPERLPCLRLSLAASESTTIEIDVPVAKTGAFEPGRAFTYRIGPDSQTIGFVLPDYVAGSKIRVRTGEAASLSAVEIGTIERPRLASSLQP